jgi:diadenosine tetraphosphate (Ap4A) HIT family hydrolase
MARINPDPYAGGHLFALVNRVTGLLDSEDDVNATVRALETDGVPTEDIDIYIGEQGARALDLSGREHGRVRRLLRTLENAVGDESATNQRIDSALRKGATLVSVRVHKRKADEKARAFRILKSLHGHEIHFWGPWAFDDVPSSATCAFCTLPETQILGQNGHAAWILDIHPISPGHSLIVPKRHVESFFETTPEERDAILSLLDQARAHVCQRHSPAGYNIGINEGFAAGQTMSHLHVHLIPRFMGDSEAPKGGVRWVIPDRADYWSTRSRT